MPLSRRRNAEPIEGAPRGVPRAFSPTEVRAVRKAKDDGPVELGPRARAASERFAKRPISPKFVTELVWLGEFTVLAGIALATMPLGSQAEGAAFWPLLVVALSGAVAGVAAIQACGGYDVAMLRRGLTQLVPVASGWGAVMATLLIGFVALHRSTSAELAWIGLWYVAGLSALLGARAVLSRWIGFWSENGRLERRAVIVGGGAAADAIIRALEAENGIVRVCGIFDDRAGRRSSPGAAGYERLGNVRELVEFARRVQLDMLIVTIPLSAQNRVLELLKSLWVLPLDIRLVAPPAADAQTPSFVRAFEKPIGEWGLVGKRAFDVILAGAALLLLLPLLVGTAAAIKLDSKGPVFFRQKRHGFNNRIIDVLKFRSMFADQADPAAARVVTKGDPRVTRLGRFLRKSSIDELPQLWNVIRGDLSLVGPRPHAVHALSSGNEAFIEIVDDYFGRHKVKPGITGWAQVNGYRGEIDQPGKLKARVDHDLYYIDNWSIAFDLSILLKTPLSLTRTENAY